MAHALHPSAFAGGRYQVRRFLGEGGKKRVYLARDTRLDRDVAIAVIRVEGLEEEAVARVRRQAEAVGRLRDHTHLVTLYDVSEEDEAPYLVSQYMDCPSLGDVLDSSEGRRLHIADAIRIASEIADALAYVHGEGILHRALKPKRVWITPDGTVKVGDFGVSFVSASRFTLEGRVVGALHYMAPERLLSRPADERSDLYSLGAILYEMVCGSPPFLGSDPATVISRHLRDPPDRPTRRNPGVPAELEDLTLALLAKAPENRPASAGVVIEALAGITPASSPRADAGPAEADRRDVEEVEDAPPDPVVKEDVDPISRAIFVGRRRELHVLEAALEEAAAGDGRLVLIGGEPGIGKTTVAEQFTDLAARRGWQVLFGRCYEGEGAPSYWPWIQTIRSYVHAREPHLVAAEMGPGASAIGQIVPTVRERLPGLPQLPSVEPEQARFRLFEAVTTFLRNATAAQPLVLLLDDLHWADHASLLLLRFLADRLEGCRLLLLGTYRSGDLDDEHPLSGAIRELRENRACRSLPLSGLSRAEVEALVKETAQHELDAPAFALAEALHEETEGNPFFIFETLRHLIETGAIYRREGRWVSDVTTVAELGIPEGVREAIGRRLNRLSDECRMLLRIGAAIGRDFGVDVLDRVCAVPLEDLVEALDTARRARVIEEVSGSPGQFRFAHALIREVLYAELSTLRRVRLHHRVGEVLEDVHRDAGEWHLGELAYHFREAAASGDVDKAVSYSTRAGDRALRLFAYEEAAFQYERALEALDLSRSAGDEQRCDLLLALGEAQVKAGDTRAGRKSFRRAADIARELGAGERVARAALGYGVGLGGYGYTDKADRVLIGLLEEALDATPEQDSVVRVRLLARLAVELFYTRAVERRERLSREAIETAQRLGHKAAELVAQYSRHLLMYGPDGIDERIRAGTRIVRLAGEAGDLEMAFRGHHFLFAARLEQGDIGSAQAELEACRRLADELRQPAYLWRTAIFQATVALTEGRFDEGERLAREALALGQRGHSNMAAVLFGTQLLNARWGQGRLGELEGVVKTFVERYPNSSFTPSLGLIYSELGREREARALLEELAGDGFRALRRDGNWLSSMGNLCVTCRFLDDSARASQLYELLAPYADRIVVGGAGSVTQGPVSLYVGMVAACMRRWDESASLFEASLERCARIATKPFAALTRYEYAATLLAHGRESDKAKAFAFLGDTLRDARELGMKRLIERAESLHAGAAGLGPIGLGDAQAASAADASRRRGA